MVWSVSFAFCGYTKHTVQCLHVLIFLRRCPLLSANTQKKFEKRPCAFGGARLVYPKGRSCFCILHRKIASLESILLQCSLEAVVCLVHVELKLPSLLIVQLLGRPHLIQGDQPLNNLALVLEFLICNLVDRLDDLDKQRVQCVLLNQADLDSVEQGDECLCRVDNERCVGKVALLSCRARRSLFDSNGYAYA